MELGDFNREGDGSISSNVLRSYPSREERELEVAEDEELVAEGLDDVREGDSGGVDRLPAPDLVEHHSRDHSQTVENDRRRRAIVRKEVDDEVSVGLYVLLGHVSVKLQADVVLETIASRPINGENLHWEGIGGDLGVQGLGHFNRRGLLRVGDLLIKPDDPYVGLPGRDQGRVGWYSSGNCLDYPRNGGGGGGRGRDGVSGGSGWLGGSLRATSEFGESPFLVSA